MALRTGAGRLLQLCFSHQAAALSCAATTEAQFLPVARATGSFGRAFPSRSWFSSAADKTSSAAASEAADKEAAAAGQEQEESSGTQDQAAEQPDIIQLSKAEHEELLKNLELYKSTLAYARADFLNLQQRTKVEKEKAEKFALQKFAKALLDVADNLERASASVPAEALANPDTLDLEKAVKLLKGLHQGVDITQKVMLKVLNDFSVARFHPLGEQFDPNLHDAQYEVPDPSKEPGTVAVVEKSGYMLHDRVLRPAQVGVTRKP